jgi:protein SCO1/2
VLLEVPSFSLTDETGQPFGSKQLAGHVYIASFLFTTCGQVCPRLAATVAKLQGKIASAGGAAMLVSFSVDPTRDTPERLREYGKAHGARPHLWKFLTGSMPAIEQAVIEGFKQPMNRTPVGANGFFDIVHGERLVLVDRQGRIRGFYDAKDDVDTASGAQGTSELLRDTMLLLNERTPAAAAR